MKKILTFIFILSLLAVNGYAQLVIRNSSNLTLFKVTSNAKVGIALGTADPAATLDVGGDLRIATVNDLAGTGNASVLVLDNGLVMKRTLPEEIWDGDESYSAGSAIDIVPLTGNEHEIDVMYDNATIKLNGSNQLYVDQLPASAGWTFYNAQQMLIECSGNCTSGLFFKWYSRSELGIPSTAQAVYVHTALADDGGNNYNLTVTELSWNDNNTDLNNAIDNGAFLTATINDTRPGHNAGIVKLHSNGLWVGLRNLGTSGVPNFVRIKVLGYLQ